MSSTTPPDHPLPSTASYVLATFILAACAGYFLGQASSIGLFSSSSSFSSSFSSHKSSNKSNSKSISKPKKNQKSSWPNSYDVEIHPDSSDEELMRRLRGGEGKKEKKKEKEDEDGGSESESESEEEEGERRRGQEGVGAGLDMFDGNREECKLVLVVRTDLGMGKGKIAAQCSHATLACYKTLLLSSSSSTSPHSSSLLRRWESSGQPKIALQISSEPELQLLRAKAVSLGLCAEVIRDAGRTQVASGSVTVLGVGPGPKGVVDGVTGGLRLL